MKVYIFLITILFLFSSCNNKYKATELRLNERELQLNKKELELKKGKVILDSLKKGEIEKITLKNTVVSTPEKIFEAWEINLEKRGIFDYVTKKDCENFDKMDKLYKNNKYPMHTESISIIPFDFNNDNLKDYVINYFLSNCVRGNGWATDFIFITSKYGSLSVNETLTNKLKIEIKNFVAKNYGTDPYVKAENNYIETKSFKVNRVIHNICYGEFDLMQEGYSCCPQISGNFEYNINENNFTVFGLKKNN